MNAQELQLEKELEALWQQLRSLHRKLRDHTYSKYRRVNPFGEDLFDWKEKGAFCGGKDVTIYDSTTIVGDVKIGDETWIGPFCSLDGSGGLTIGRHCSISLGCQLLTHDTVKWAVSGGRAKYEYAATTVGECCFLGSFCVIAKGTSVGKHCIVGAGSVVTKNIPDFCIAIGAPARVVGTIEIDNEDVRISYFQGS